MNSAMLAIGSMSLYKSALVIALGAAACFALFYALYSAHGGFGAAAWLFTAADIVLSVLFCRFLHYYCHAEQYGSFFKAMGNYSSGGYVLAGVVPAALAAAYLVKLAGLTQNPRPARCWPWPLSGSAPCSTAPAAARSPCARPFSSTCRSPHR